MKLRVFLFLLLFGCLVLPAAALGRSEQAVTQLIKKSVLAKYPSWQGLEIQITYKFADQFFQKLDSQGDQVKIKLAETYNEIKPVGNVVFPLAVIVNGATKKVFLRAKVEVFAQVVVAKNRIKRGQNFLPEDLTLEARDIAMLPQKYFLSYQELLGQEAKTSIPIGAIVLGWMAQKIPLVCQGGNVTICVIAPNLLVKTSGVALEDGYLNETIKVRRLKSKETLVGILVSSSEVKVNLQ